MDEKDKELQELRRKNEYLNDYLNEQKAFYKGKIAEIKRLNKYIDNVIIKAIERYGKAFQSVIAIEEMSELQKELTKAIRKMYQAKQPDKKAITEEWADVQIMLWQIQKMYELSDDEIDEVIHDKVLRLDRVVDGIIDE